MQIEPYLDLPAMVKPSLRKDALYQIRIGDNGIEVATAAGFYGHKSSEPLLVIPPNRLVRVWLTKDRWLSLDWCRITYLDDQNVECSLAFTIKFQTESSGGRLGNKATRKAARVIEKIIRGEPAWEHPPVRITAKPLGLATTLLLPLLLFGAILLRIMPPDGFDLALLEVGVFLFFIALPGIFVYQIQMHTSWPTIGKIGASILVILLAVILWIVSVSIIDHYRLEKLSEGLFLFERYV